MKYSNEFINKLFLDTIELSNNIAAIYHYPDNITHLLYIIIPAFILKYGTTSRKVIEECFKKIPILIKDEQNKVAQAYYFSTPYYQDGNIMTNKGIVLRNYNNISLMQLLDNLVHEFNHAVNSYMNEIKVNNEVLIRTGIVYNHFNKNNLTFIKKGEEIILEEVINTKQTELIIDLIKSFSEYEINSSVVNSTLYSIYHSFSDNYKSNSYYLESYVCQDLMKNKTFLSTLETLRFEGQIEDIHDFFDNITGKKGSLLELSKCLNKSLSLQKELPNTKLFKKNKINKIKEINKKALEIVNVFNNNTIYK